MVPQSAGKIQPHLGGHLAVVSCLIMRNICFWVLHLSTLMPLPCVSPLRLARGKAAW